MITIGVLGLGATGANVVRQLRPTASEGPEEREVLVHDRDHQRQVDLVRAVGFAIREGNSSLSGASVVVLASPSGDHAQRARALLGRGVNVVSVSDSSDDVDDLLALDSYATSVGKSVVVGAGFAPGLTCLLARFAGDHLDVVEEIAVSKAGTAGPACARQHHGALKSEGRDWIDGNWVTRRGGSGRELAWFPGPIGARDCYRGALPSPTLLQRHYPRANRISARVSATRRDRFTSRLPMLLPPHRDGGPGAVRVEVRGRNAGAYETWTYGVMDHPSVAAGTVAAITSLSLSRGELPVGAFGLSEISEPALFLRELHRRGVKAARFEGTSRF